MEQPPVTALSEKLAPTLLSIPTPRQSVLREPQETVPEISPAKKIRKARQESEPIPPATSIPESAQPRIFPQAAPTLRDDEPVGDVIAPASHEVGSQQKTGRAQLAVALKPIVIPEPRERELPARSDIQAIVPTIRPRPPVAPLSPVAATASSTINVTIGRVEIRAVPPPAQQRAKVKPAPVLSLEDYLRQRANGDCR